MMNCLVFLLYLFSRILASYHHILISSYRDKFIFEYLVDMYHHDPKISLGSARQDP